MAFKALTGIAPEWFEPERFKIDPKSGDLMEVTKEKPDCTKIQIKPLGGTDFLVCVTAPSTAAQITTACRKGIIGWDNLPDENGAPVDFSEDKITEVLPGEIMSIISAKILDISKMSTEQEKNS